MELKKISLRDLKELGFESYEDLIKNSEPIEVVGYNDKIIKID